MRTIEINLYKFDELSEAAKQKAIEWWRNSEDYSWLTHEATESLNKFCEVFNISWYQIDWEYPERNEYEYHLDENILNLSGWRLARYLWNNYRNDIFKGKYYGKLVDTEKDGTKIEKSKEHPAGVRHVKRYSGCQLENSCVFTGVCWDQVLLQPIYDFLDCPDGRDFKDLLHEGITELCHSVNNEIEARNQDDEIADTIRANDYDFTAGGSIY